MTTMNLKPISWVGDMYTRFESMCLEVEEAICQDTVKFVENQVQTVGVGVKKFYSDFMQDLLSSSVGTEGNSDVVLSNISKVIGEKKSVDIGTQQMVNNCDIDNGNNSVDSALCCLVECNFSKPYESNSNVSVEEKYAADDDIESHFAELDLPNLDTDATKDLDEKKDSESKFLSVTSKPTELCASAELREIQKESNEPLCGDLDYSLNSNSVIKASCCENDGVGISQQMTEGFESSVVDGETTVPSIGDLLPHFAGESNSQVAYQIQFGDVGEQVPIDEVIDEVKLGESCVLVEKSDHSFFLPPEHKQKSYKKTIRGVFIQRRWSKGKEDKKQNVVWYEEPSATNLAPTSSVQSTTEDSHSNEFVESEWELL